jgi:antitoxin component YwqK of YwqJK toxin-antitoxin module
MLLTHLTNAWLFHLKKNNNFVPQINERYMKKTLILLTFLTSFLGANASIYAIAGDTNKTDANGKKTGLWIEKTEMTTYHGRYKDDKREGAWIGYHPNGIISSVVEYRNGRKNGASIGIDVAGFFFRRDNYTNDTLDGPSIIYSHNNGAKLQSEIGYKMGKMDGVKRVYYPDGTLQEEATYSSDKRNGISRWYLSDGTLSIAYNYKNGNMEGMQKTFYPNGNIASEVNAVNNLEEGAYTEYFQKGNVKLEGKYLHGKKEGPWKEFDEDGKLIKTEIYKNGELKSKK